MPHHPRMPATRLRIAPWIDAEIDKRGFPARSNYVEWFWLPVLGPTAIVLFWWLQSVLDIDREFSMTLDARGRDMGLGTSESKHSPLRRAISQLVRFGLAKRGASGQLLVRRFAPPIPQVHVERFPPHVQEIHSEIVRRVWKAGGPDPLASAPSPTGDPTDD
jgi:hypothetical protein